MGMTLFNSEGQVAAKNWSRRVGLYLFLSLVLGGAGFLGMAWASYEWRFSPAKRFYSEQYAVATMGAAAFPEESSNYLVAMNGESTGFLSEADMLGVDFDARTKNWTVFFDTNRYPNGVVLKKVRVKNREMVEWLRLGFFEGKTLFGVWFWEGVSGGMAGLLFFVSTVLLDNQTARNRRRGIRKRGIRPVTPRLHNKLLKSAEDAFELEVGSAWKANDFFECDTFEFPNMRNKEGRETVLIPKLWLRQHVRVVGDTGVGKSQLTDRFLEWLERIEMPYVIYDPDGRFWAKYGRPQRGDVLLNPLDERFPGFQLIDEVTGRSDATAVAAALFPEPGHESDSGKWFRERTCELLTYLLSLRPTNAELLEWIQDETLIDDFLSRISDPIKKAIAKDSKDQRNGILGTLIRLGNVLKLLEGSREGKTTWSTRKWSENRLTGKKGCVFVSTRATDRSVAGMFNSFVIDQLIRRGMEADDKAAQKHETAVVIDELNSVVVPSLMTGFTELRKYGIWLWAGYQSDQQLIDKYGRAKAETILSQPKTVFCFRLSGGESSERISRDLGSFEIVRERVSTTEGVNQSRDSSNLANEVKVERAAPAFEIQNLEDLEFYMRCGNLVRLKLDYRKPVRRNEEFVLRARSREDFWKIR